LGDGDGLGDGVGLGVGPGGTGVGDGVGPLPGVLEATALLVPPQPAVSNKAETIAHRIKTLKKRKDEFTEPSRASWRLGAQLLCLHPACTYLPGEKRVTLLGSPRETSRENA
jgi:hypothetical protein